MWKLAIWLIRRSPGRPLGRRDPASICPDVEQQHLKALLYVIVLILSFYWLDCLYIFHHMAACPAALLC